LNKKFRAAQKVLDREAAYVAQAGNEIEKLLADLPPISISPTADSTSALESSSRCPQNMVVNPMELLLDDEPSDDGLLLGCKEMGASGDSETMLEENSENSNSNHSNSMDKSSPTTEDTKGHHRGPRVKDVAKLLGVLVDRLGSLKRKVKVH
jgi:hypothetical protein